MTPTNLIPLHPGPRRSRTGVAAIATTHTAVDLVVGAITALLPVLAERFRLDGTGLGLLVAVLSASALLSQPLVGRLADYVGARPVVVASAFVTSSLLALTGVVDHLGLLYALVVVGGLGSAAFHPAAAVVARRLLPDRAALTVSIFSVGGFLGLALGPLLVLLVIAEVGPAFTPLLMVPGTVLAVVLWAILPADIASRRRALLPAGCGRLLGSGVGVVAAAGTLAAVSVSTFSAGVPLWVASQSSEGYDLVLIGWTLALFEVAAAAGGFAAGWSAARVPAAVTAATTLLAAPIPLALSLQADPGSIGFFAAVVAGGFLLNSSFPLLIVAAQDRAPGAVGAASGMLMGFANGAGGIAFLGIGVLIDVLGLGPALLVGFGFAVPAAAVAAISLARTPRTAAEQRATPCDPFDLLAAA
jgi:MFS transporter, FSR family, fosmidomycin resistance protein